MNLWRTHANLKWTINTLVIIISNEHKQQGRNHWVGGPDPQLSGGPPNFWHNVFVRGVHHQASRVDSVYNTEEGRKKEEFFPVIIAGIILFYV